ncbi:MAG: cyclic nucleotide-binding domain-containing protein [Planctomycetota bacterium]|nr:cyclic nucleotide-binding domain-containing protein [Planctomycetota bacterium]
MDTILRLVDALQDRPYEAGEDVLREGENSDELFLLSEGAVEILRKDVRICEIAERGALFGEISALLGIPHMATVRTLRPSRFKVVNQVKPFLHQAPDVCREVAVVLAWRLVETSNFLADLRTEFLLRSQAASVEGSEESKLLGAFREYWLQSWKLFERQHYQDAGIETETLRYEQFLPGEVVLRQGVRDEKLLILRTGSVEVVKNETPLFMVWDRGVLFGEISALLGTGHTATVRALEPSTFQVVESADKLFRRHVDVAWYVARLLAKRLLDANKYFVGLKQQLKRLTDELQKEQATQLVELLEEAEQEMQKRHVLRPGGSGLHSRALEET